MFTGLIEAMGTIEQVSVTAAGREFRVSAPWGDLTPGESIALNGACLTVREAGASWFTVAAVVTTLDRTTMGAWQEGRRINLERAVQVGDRLGGHLVQGHVDGVGHVREATQRGDALLVDVSLPPEVAELMVPHGSLCLDGVSLTVNALPAPGVVQVSLIAWTAAHTTLGSVRPGDAVHVEADVIGKYVRALMAPWRPPAGPS